MSEFYKEEDVLEFLNLHCPKDMWEYQIEDVPSIDIVFCKDCKYWYESTCRDGCDRGLCYIGVTLEDDYCSYGERKDETD